MVAGNTTGCDVFSDFSLFFTSGSDPMARGIMLVVPSGVCTRKRYTSGGTSLATVISSKADCFLASGTAAAVENFRVASSSGRSVIWEIFAVIPGASKITALAPERLRPSRVKVAVLPRSMPTGHIFARLGGMMGSSAHSGNANNETQSRIFIFTWHLAQGDASLYWLATCFFSSPAAGWRGVKTVHSAPGTLSFFTSYRLSVPLNRPAASHLPSGLMASACTHSGW